MSLPAKREKEQENRMDCEHCVFFCYDEEADEELCNLYLDEDEQLRFLTSESRACPYFQLYDEYKTVRKQN